MTAKFVLDKINFRIISYLKARLFNPYSYLYDIITAKPILRSSRYTENTAY